MNDKVVLGAVIGLLADGVKLLANYIAFLMGLTKVVFWQLTASRFLAAADLFKPEAYLVGATADLTITAVLGIVFIYFLRYTGRDYIWFKGIGLAMVVWVVLLGTLLETAQPKLPLNSSNAVVTIFAHLAYGLALAFFTKLFYKRKF